LLFMRVTLLGSAGSGKTTLANAYVNNTAPTNYQPTTEARLYYTVTRSSGGDDASGFSVLGEIEDTPPSDRTPSEDLNKFFDLWSPSTKDEASRTRDPKKKDELHPYDKNFMRDPMLPFTTYEAPLDMGYNPLTKNRMAFFLLFDATSNQSYLEALRIHGSLKEFWEKKELKLKPIVFLVANKIDKDPLDETFLSVMESASMYSEFNALKLYKVSASQYNGVKKLFRSAMQAVLTNQALWIMDIKQKALYEEETNKCCIQ